MKNNFFVVDTNILISAFLFAHSSPTKAFDKVKQLGKIAASFETYKELGNIIVRPKFDKYVSLEKRLMVLDEIKNLFVFHEPLEKITACRDPKDNKFLELAISANASCIVTGDKHLLVLHLFLGIPILNAVDFINNF